MHIRCKDAVKIIIAVKNENETKSSFYYRYQLNISFKVKYNMSC